jgi:hypothetical protein
VDPGARFLRVADVRRSVPPESSLPGEKCDLLAVINVKKLCSSIQPFFSRPSFNRVNRAGLIPTHQACTLRVLVPLWDKPITLV